MKSHARTLFRPDPAACLAAALFAAACAVQARAQTATDKPWLVEAATARQQLSNGSADWQERTARLAYRTDKHRVSEITLTQTERFGLADEQLGALAVRPLGEQLALTVEGNASPTHRVLPRHQLGASLQYEFARAWLAHAGLRSTHYDSAVVTQGALMLEHYVSSFSWLAAWRPVQTLGSSTSSTELRGSYYYGERSALSLSVASGQEAVQLSDTALQLADVHASTLSGRHWFHPDWALSYEWKSTRQGDFYTRTGWRIGVQHRF